MAADQTDAAFTDAGTRATDADEVRASGIVFEVDAPTADEIWRLRQGATIVSLIAPGRSPQADRTAPGSA